MFMEVFFFFFLLPLLYVFSLLIRSRLITLLSNAHPWHPFEALRTKGLRLWIFTWACSYPPCFSRPLQSSRSASSHPPGTWRSLAVMPRQRWAMVWSVQSTFWVGQGCASLARAECPARVSEGICADSVHTVEM